jgi:hypothetical protein
MTSGFSMTWRPGSTRVLRDALDAAPEVGGDPDPGG